MVDVSDDGLAAHWISPWTSGQGLLTTLSKESVVTKQRLVDVASKIVLGLQHLTDNGIVLHFDVASH